MYYDFGILRFLFSLFVKILVVCFFVFCLWIIVSIFDVIFSKISGFCAEWNFWIWFFKKLF